MANRALATAIALNTTLTGMATTATVAFTAAIKGLWVAIGGPLVRALAVAAVAAYGLWKVYRLFFPSQDTLNKKLEEQRKKQEEANAVMEDARDRISIVADAQLEHIELMQRQSDKANALKAAMEGANKAGDVEHQLRAGRELLKVLDDWNQANEKLRNSRIERIQLLDRELQTAKEALKVEQDKDQTLRASIGALTAGEQKHLERLVTKVEGGGSLTKREAIDIGKLGGQAGQKVGEGFLATMDKGLGARISKINGDTAKAQAKVEKLQKSFDQTTHGKSAEDAIKSIDSFSDAVAKTIDAVKVEIVSKLGELIFAIRDQKLEQNNQRTAARHVGPGGF